MKNILALSRPSEIEAYVRAQLRTDTFRQSSDDPCGYIKHWIARFSQVPRVFFDMSVPRVEHCHFTPWFGAFHHRTYENPAVNDLFWLHEIVHATTMPYDETQSFEDWFLKIEANERDAAALESEAMAYMELPGLRDQTFDFPIWVDRFLGVSGVNVSRHRLRVERRRAMHDPDPHDRVECEMATYPRQNRVWAEIWRDRFREPEAAMARLVRESENNREEALAHYLEWLTNDTGMTEQRPYPFPQEAEEFSEVFWASKERGTTRDTGSGDARHACTR
jgi:hypothetical protein